MPPKPKPITVNCWSVTVDTLIRQPATVREIPTRDLVALHAGQQP